MNHNDIRKQIADIVGEKRAGKVLAAIEAKAAAEIAASDARLIVTTAGELSRLGLKIMTKGRDVSDLSPKTMLAVPAGLLRAQGPAGARFADKELAEGHRAELRPQQVATKAADPAEARVQRKMEEAKEGGAGGNFSEVGLRALYKPGPPLDLSSPLQRQAAQTLRGDRAAKQKALAEKRMALLDERLRRAGVDPASEEGRAISALFGPMSKAAGRVSPDYERAVDLMHGKKSE